MLTGRVRHWYKVAIRAAIYAVLRPFIEMFRRLPPRAARALGGALTAGVWPLLRGPARQSIRNLGIAMPELPETARARIAAAHARHLGRSLAEYLSLTARPPALLAREVRIEGLDRVAQARSEGHGIVILTAHFGSWEVAAASMSLALGGLGVIARDLYDIRITRLINRLRSRFKISSYDTADVRGLLRFLKGGGILGVLIDQDSRRVATLPVPFFGHDAATPVGPIRLAERAEASVFMGFIVEEAGGYRLLLEELPDVRTGAEGVLARFNARLESLVRSHPEQWVWMHDRWRSSASVAAT